MSRYSPYSRREFRRRRLYWVKRNLRLVLGLTGGLLGLLILEGLLLLGISKPTAFSWWLLGALQATALAAYAYLLATAFLANDGKAIHHLRGFGARTTPGASSNVHDVDA